MAFPTSNLPTSAVPWGREVEKQINTVTATVKSNEVNNAARDNQLAASLARVQTAQARADAAFAATGIISGDVTALETDVNTLETNVYYPGSTNINGGNIRTGTIGATQISASYVYAGTVSASQITTGTLNASLITVNNLSASSINTGTLNASLVTVTNLSADSITTGTLSGDRITGGTITGTTITGGILSTSGNRHVTVSGTSIAFFDEDGNSTGSISGSGATRASAVQMLSSSATGVYAYNGGTDVVGPGCSLSVGNSNNNQIVLNATSGIVMNNPVTFSSGISGATTINGQLTLGTTNAFVAPGIYNPTGGTSAAATNMYVGSNGNVVRTTNTSSRKSKHDIRELQFNSDDYLSVKPVVFKYNEGILREEEKDSDIIGFIAEDFEDAGFGEQLIVQPDNLDELIELRYNKMYMFLHKVVAEQQETIKSLTARIGILENK